MSRAFTFEKLGGDVCVPKNISQVGGLDNFPVPWVGSPSHSVDSSWGGMKKIAIQRMGTPRNLEIPVEGGG